MKTKNILLFISLLISFPLWATDVTDAHIAGHVLDANTQEHLAFANVQVKGTSMGCLTDASGHFYLKNLPVGTHTVVFSMMGYETI
jgi:outer membrane receptor for ferrienterochelin and colicins